MKKSLRENPDAGLVILVLFFLIAIIAGMWLYQAKVLQKHLPQNKPEATVKQAGTPSLVLHGDLNQLSIAGNRNDDNNGTESGAGAAQTGKASQHNANPSQYTHKDYPPGSVSDIGQGSALPDLKVNVQPACGANAGSCLGGSLSSAESLVKNL